MAKVLVRYGVHPREKGRFAVPFLIPKYKNDPQVRFRRYPYGKTADFALLSRIREDPAWMKAPTEERRWLFYKTKEREESYRKKLAGQAARRGFITLEVHTWGAEQPMVIYSKAELRPVAAGLVKHLRKMGYKDVILAGSPLDKPSISLELPGTAKAHGKAADQLGNLLRMVGSTMIPAYTQNLEQLRLSKRLLRDTIDFLKTAEVKR